MAKLYDVTAWRDYTHYAMLTVDAESPAAAIEKSRQLFENGDTDYEACDEGWNPVHFMSAEPNSDCNEPPLSPDDPANNAEWLALEAPSNTALIQASRAMLAALEEISEAQREGVAVVNKQGAAFPARLALACDGGRAAIAQAEAAGITTKDSDTCSKPSTSS